QNSGVRIPALLDADLAHGYLLLEDLGDTLLLPRLAPGVVDQYYRRAFDILLLLAQADCSQAALPDYDATLLQEELGRFPHWFVGELLGHSLSQTELALLRSLFDALVGSALEQPRVLVHRDFHSRNLMLPADGRLAVIDFQDAVRGPVTYDLVSLLRDCYVSWPAPRVRDWALHYRELLLRAAALDVADADTFLRWFDLMGLQRHIKVLGTFARLYLRDDKPGYLADLPLVLRYTLEILAKYAAEQPQCAEALRWFDTELMPRARQQTWGAQL
ncbi:MAG: phosphotransferase, partial [Halioglobus sp.]|nr:phosphotransferase [Halioglobus sp.]